MANDYYDELVDSPDDVPVATTTNPDRPVIPLKPFSAHRTIPAAGYERSPVTVIGVRWEPDGEVWQFICICEDGDEGIYIQEDDALIGDLPYLPKSRASQSNS
ncbi:hypothetical protein NJB95_07405 [Brucella intermedia]|uniref:hypothetical protein n=1 Tax=Brucella intermedia TaxID=94625 RepID=UPI00209B019E|nr:hypothetical protein [Brucella intermedia]MCO7736437.1 hypothetical protein [Brucella intermedia]